MGVCKEKIMIESVLSRHPLTDRQIVPTVGKGSVMAVTLLLSTSDAIGLVIC